MGACAGVKRTCRFASHLSASDPKRTSDRAQTEQCDCVDEKFICIVRYHSASQVLGAVMRRRRKVDRKKGAKRHESLGRRAGLKNTAQLTRERDEALEQQAATAEVLKIISSSIGHLEPIFQTILANAIKL